MTALAASPERTVGWVLVGTCGIIALVALLVFGWLAVRIYRAYGGWWWRYEYRDRPELSYEQPELRNLNPEDTIPIPRPLG